MPPEQFTCIKNMMLSARGFQKENERKTIAHISCIHYIWLSLFYFGKAVISCLIVLLFNNIKISTCCLIISLINTWVFFLFVLLISRCIPCIIYANKCQLTRCWQTLHSAYLHVIIFAHLCWLSEVSSLEKDFE